MVVCCSPKAMNSPEHITVKKMYQAVKNINATHQTSCHQTT
ncbi:MAG: hypothetical protein ACI8WB_004322 [Phenylobacterium sp.]|jgi:hypothetical protein